MPLASSYAEKGIRPIHEEATLMSHRFPQFDRHQRSQRRVSVAGLDRATLISAGLIAAGVGLAVFAWRRGRLRSLACAALGAGASVCGSLAAIARGSGCKMSRFEQPGEEIRGNRIDEAAWESFPASDPPGYGSSSITKASPSAQNGRRP
jgi:hypothetical protein